MVNFLKPILHVEALIQSVHGYEFTIALKSANSHKSGKLDIYRSTKQIFLSNAARFA